MATTKAKWNIIVFDFETGGLQCRENPVLEIACIVLDAFSLREITRYEAFIKPYKSLEGNELKLQQAALDYNGINMSDVYTKGKDVKVVVNELCKMMEDVNKGTPKFSKPILAGHNVDFDIPFLQYIFAVAGKDLKKYLLGKDDAYGNFQPAFVDTIKMGSQAFGDDPSILGMTLGELCKYLGFTLVDAHSAMPDVEATAKALTILINRMRNNVTTEAPVAAIEQYDRKPRQRNSFQF